MKPEQVQSVCILGRQPALGLGELESLYGSGTVWPLAPQAAGLSLHSSDVDFARLGGSTRLAHLLAQFPTTDWKRLERELPELITELALTLPDGKIQLGLSAFGLKISAAKLNAAGLSLKKVIRERTGRSVRVTPNPELELNTAQVLHNHLAGPTGIELLLVACSDGSTVIARTSHVQDIDSYTLRDRGRPRRDARVGMLPPKLAQVLINLASGQIKGQELRDKSQGITMLDPFCGTGVTLQEAMLMGYSVYGTDLEPRMIDYSRANLDWLADQFPDHKLQAINRKLEPADATTSTWTEPIDSVAAETYLGRPFTERPSAEVLARTVSEVNLILKKFLKNIHGQLTPGTRLCLAVPAWNTRPIKDLRLKIKDGDTEERPRESQVVNRQSLIVNHFRHLPLVDQISDLGYNRVRFEHVRDQQLLYYREDQIVARELLVLMRK